MFQEIWTEKYRPKKLDDIIGQEHVVSRLKPFIANGSLPHCLFAGPAGVGKTTTALCIANELFGSGRRSNFLELNASDERGIDTIRTKVKDFARTRAINTKFKIIYLDEADALTKDAQHALRRIMESYSNICRFILACNYSSKIIPPIQSRTAVFRFSRLTDKQIKQYLENIVDKEGLKIEAPAYEIIIKLSEGDLRRATNILQTAATTGGVITEKMIYEVCTRAHPKDVKEMIDLALNKRFKQAREKLLDILYNQGMNGEDVIKEIHRQIHNLDIPDKTKMDLIIKTGEYEFRLTEGSNAQVQLEALLAQFGVISNHS